MTHDALGNAMWCGVSSRHVHARHETRRNTTCAVWFRLIPIVRCGFVLCQVCGVVSSYAKCAVLCRLVLHCCAQWVRCGLVVLSLLSLVPFARCFVCVMSAWCLVVFGCARAVSLCYGMLSRVCCTQQCNIMSSCVTSSHATTPHRAWYETMTHDDKTRRDDIDISQECRTRRDSCQMQYDMRCRASSRLSDGGGSK